jgi:hypothetical protein
MLDKDGLHMIIFFFVKMFGAPLDSLSKVVLVDKFVSLKRVGQVFSILSKRVSPG